VIGKEVDVVRNQLMRNRIDLLIGHARFIDAHGGTVEYLVDAVFNYPTFSEAYKVAALDVMNKVRALNQFRR
jgi:pyruvate/2-oxoglutarate dehydrogenase complex dihydrolipoamide dehydrogenase (E3) component